MWTHTLTRAWLTAGSLYQADTVQHQTTGSSQRTIQRSCLNLFILFAYSPHTCLWLVMCRSSAVVGVLQTVVQMCCPQRLEVDTEKTYRVFMSHEHSSRQNHNIKAANKSFENLAKYKYLGRTPPDQSRVRETINTTLNSGNTIHHSIHFLACNPRIRRLKGVHKYNFACGFIWVWNTVSQIAGGTYIEDDRQRGAADDI